MNPSDEARWGDNERRRERHIEQLHGEIRKIVERRRPRNQFEPTKRLEIRTNTGSPARPAAHELKRQRIEDLLSGALEIVDLVPHRNPQPARKMIVHRG